MDEYNPQQLSTYALTMFRKNLDIDGKNVKVDIGTRRGKNGSTRCIRRLPSSTCASCASMSRVKRPTNTWERGTTRCATRAKISCILVANKIDIDYQVTRKNFKFASSKNIPFYFVSAADGTNVVKVFRAAAESALDYKDNSGDFMNEAYKLLDDA